MISKRKPGKRKDSNVSGEILLQFSLSDPLNPASSPLEVFQKFRSVVCASEEEDEDPQATSSLEDADKDEETSDETDDPTKPEVVEKRKRRLRLARLRRKSLARRAYQFSGSSSGVQGIVFIEVVKVRDLPPERNRKKQSPPQARPVEGVVRYR